MFFQKNSSAGTSTDSREYRAFLCREDVLPACRSACPGALMHSPLWCRWPLKCPGETWKKTPVSAAAPWRHPQDRHSGLPSTSRSGGWLCHTGPPCHPKEHRLLVHWGPLVGVAVSLGGGLASASGPLGAPVPAGPPSCSSTRVPRLWPCWSQPGSSSW